MERGKTDQPTPLRQIAIGVGVGLVAIIVGLGILRFFFDWPYFGIGKPAPAAGPNLSCKLRWEGGVLVADVAFSGNPDPKTTWTSTLTMDGIESDPPAPIIQHKALTFTARFSRYMGQGGKSGAVSLTYDEGHGKGSGMIGVSTAIPVKP